MSDPAVEAAQRAEDENTGRIPPFGWDDALDGAIQALKPIREKHREWADALEQSPTPAAAIALAVLADLAPLIFTTEELNQ